MSIHTPDDLIARFKEEYPEEHAKMSPEELANLAAASARIVDSINNVAGGSGSKIAEAAKQGAIAAFAVSFDLSHPLYADMIARAGAVLWSAGRLAIIASLLEDSERALKELGKDRAPDIFGSMLSAMMKSEEKLMTLIERDMGHLSNLSLALTPEMLSQRKAMKERRDASATNQ